MAGPFIFPVNGIESIKAEDGEIVISLCRRDGQILKLILPKPVQTDLKLKLDRITPAPLE